MTQTWNAKEYVRNASFVAEFGKGVLDWLQTKAPARILDLGCGDGALAQELVTRGYDVVGVDASASMVEATKQRGIQASRVDGHALTFADEFDAVFSNATLHWLTRPDEVLAGVRNALRAGGEFVAEFGGAGNTALVLAALRAEREARDLPFNTPWYFPSVEAYADKLVQHGFRVDAITSFARPTRLPGDVLDWVATFGESFTRDVADREDFLAAVRARLVPRLRQDGVWTLDYVRLRFRAFKA